METKNILIEIMDEVKNNKGVRFMFTWTSLILLFILLYILASITLVFMITHF